VKLMDFGLAKEQRQLSDDTATQDGSVLGTPLYMAPEQITGEDSGPLTDVYAFACVAYELLSGKKLFEARNMTQLLQEKLTRSVPAAYEIGAGVSPEMHRLLVGGLEKDPAKRLGSLRQVLGWRGELDPDFLAKLFPKSEGPA
jgi:serine/threonine-protein kinase